MHHGWRSSWSGVRTPVRLSVQGPVGEAPATAPFSIPLHHRYRRCVGWRVSSSFSFVQLHGMLSLAVLSLKAVNQQKKQSPNHHTPAAARSTTGAACAAGTASPPRTPPQRGLELTSSGQRQAALPLWYMAQKTTLCTFSLRNALTERMVCNGGWACGPLTATLTPQSVLSNE